jgi:hypothetical protein
MARTEAGFYIGIEPVEVVDLETDRITNSLNTLTEEIAQCPSGKAA